MPIPRLPAHASDLDLSITIPKTVRPYLTEWYKDTKEDGETPDTFALRILKEQAHAYYIGREAKAAMEAQKAEDKAQEEAINNDLTALVNELK